MKNLRELLFSPNNYSEMKQLEKGVKKIHELENEKKELDKKEIEKDQIPKQSNLTQNNTKTLLNQLSKEGILDKVKVNSLPNKREDLVFLNCIFHNKKDFDGKDKIYLKINDITTYVSNHRDDVEESTIEMSQILRRLFKINNGNPYASFQELVINTLNPIKKLKINVNLLGEKKEIISIHEEEVKDHIKNIFKKHIFFPNQNLIFDYEERKYLIEVGNSKGIINESTEIELNCDDVNLNIIGSKLLKRDLFKKDYNFESLGIGGIDNSLVTIFKSALSSRAFNASTIEKMGIRHVKGILLFGPPGTGKTLVARKIGSMISNIEPKVIQGPEILNSYIGKSEENVRNLFKEAIDDKNNENLHVIIFDEIDAICKKRGREGAGANVNDNIVNQLLSLIDGIHALNNIFIIAMTNRKELLDPALLRAGRIEICLYIGLPDLEGRKQIFRIHTEKLNKSKMVKDIDYDVLANLTENYSGAEIESVVKRASTNALHELLSSDKENINDSEINVNMQHFMSAIDSIQPMYGKNNKKLENLLPEFYDSKIHDTYNLNLNNILKELGGKYNFKKFLITGESRTGKSTLLVDIALKANIKYTKLVRVIDTITQDEITKTHYISDIILESHNSNDSLVIIDDIEIVINYANLLNTISFSNRLYQMLLTILKSAPDNKNNRMTLLISCGNEDVTHQIKDYFDGVFELTN